MIASPVPIFLCFHGLCVTVVSVVDPDTRRSSGDIGKVNAVVVDVNLPCAARVIAVEGCDSKTARGGDILLILMANRVRENDVKRGTAAAYRDVQLDTGNAGVIRESSGGCVEDL